MEARIEELIRAIPKAENHYHLDAISAELMWKFANRNHVEIPYQSLEEVKQVYKYQSLEEFVNVYLIACSTIMTEEDIYDMVIDCAQAMKEQNIVYREAMFDYPACFGSRGIPFSVIASGLEKGLKAAKEEFGADIRLIANLDRMSDVTVNLEYLHEMVNYLDRLPIIAVGLDNAENGFPAHNQTEAFAFAKEHGLFLTAHAGEDCGAESVRDAMESLKLDRIDHGIRAMEDDDLMEILAEREILCTVCPESNIVLGAASSWEVLPIRRFMDQGIRFSISSDDPPFFSMDMAGNIIKIAEVFELSEVEIRELILNSFRYNFAGQEYLPLVESWISENWR
ncbi:MAG: adenosine deaminase [Eubacteriales bacterium]|nr:adenosine deaminase [Eubacteriales bacterium]